MGILAIVFFLISIGLYMISVVAKKSEDKDFQQYAGTIRNIGLACLVAAVLSFTIASVCIVDGGFRGVVKNGGAIQPVPLNEGINFVMPIYQQVIQMDVRQQKHVTQSVAATMDMQNLTTSLTLNYHPIPSEVAWIYKEVGIDYEDKII
jgi:regulator of protease activity HflC (stomatin/prohibitin superfamily)